MVVQNTFYAGFAVVGGIGEILGLLSTCAVVVVVRHRRGSFVLAGVAAIAFVGMLLSLAFINRPVNDRVATWTAATLPQDWATYRDRWDAARALSAVFGGACLLYIAGFHTGRSTVTRRRHRLSTR